jgi:hypothetical protein
VIPDLFPEPGWAGVFTRNQAPAAIPNGTRVVKVNSERNDGHANGTNGMVLGSMSHPDVMDGAVLYFVEWDSSPRVAVGCIHWKIHAVLLA